MIASLSYLIMAAVAVGLAYLFLSNQKDGRRWQQLSQAVDRSIRELCVEVNAQPNTSTQLTRWRGLEGGELKRVVELPDETAFCCELTTLDELTFKVSCTWSRPRDAPFRLELDLKALRLGLRDAMLELPLRDATPYLEALGLTQWLDGTVSVVFSATKLSLTLEAPALTTKQELVAYLERVWASGRAYLRALSALELEQSKEQLLRLCCQLNLEDFERQVRFVDALVASYPQLAAARREQLLAGVAREHVPSMIAWLGSVKEPLPELPRGQLQQTFWAALDRYGELDALIEAWPDSFVEVLRLEPERLRLNAACLCVYARRFTRERFNALIGELLKAEPLEVCVLRTRLILIREPEPCWSNIICAFPPTLAAERTSFATSAGGIHGIWSLLLLLRDKCWALCEPQAQGELLSWLEQVALHAASCEPPMPQEHDLLMRSLIASLSLVGEHSSIKVLGALAQARSSRHRASAHAALKALLSRLEVDVDASSGSLSLSEQGAAGGLSLSDDPQGKLSILPK